MNLHQIRSTFFSIIIGISIAIPVFARTSNDPLYDHQWYLEKISAPEAWNTATGSRDVVVAVIDSGVDFDHEDLAENLWTNGDEIAGNGKDDDKNGYIDDTNGWDFVEDDNTPTPDKDEPFAEDGVAHGTVIAGLIGAVGNNAIGVSGINWKTSIMPLRILDNYGAGDSGNARDAIQYAIDNGADVINLSFTGYEVDEAFEYAINAAYIAGIPVVAAVGNSEEGIDLNKTPIYPACFEGKRADWVIGVAATNKNDERAYFSNYGSECTELSAPGVDIFGLMYEDDDWADFSSSYAGGWEGTSVAAPLVTGAIALLKGAYSSLTPSLIRTILQLSADPLKEDGVGKGQMGTGRLNIANALAIAPSFVTAEPQIGISPITGEYEEIDVVTAGSYIRSPGFDTVYYVDEDQKRHPLWDTQTFFTWKDSFGSVAWVTDATLSTLSLGAVLPPQPGVVLVKVQSEETVYAVETGATTWRPVLREISSESIAISLYGPSWSDYVIDIEPTLFSHYSIGEAMTAEDTIDTSILKLRSTL